MKPLYLSGYGVKIRVNSIQLLSELEVVDGREQKDHGNTYAFQPRRIPFDSIVIDGHSGYISFQACHWLSRNNIPVFVMNYNGEIISSILPPAPIKADLRIAQFQAANNLKKKDAITRALVHAKIIRSLQVLTWLGGRHDIERELQATRKEASKLGEASSGIEIRTVEARTALRYWEAYGKVLAGSLRFKNRSTKSRPNKASDPVNLALNYGYGFLEGECRRAVNVVGLEPSVGFLHDFSASQTKQSLVYDLQEPFRWLVDLVVMKAFESGLLDKSDFFFSESDYRLGFMMEAKGQYLDLLRERFNSGVQYKGRLLKWDTVIQQKTNELARFLTGRSSSVDFSEPAPVLT
jgi:CRISPR-associated protein Cas1